MIKGAALMFAVGALSACAGAPKPISQSRPAARPALRPSPLVVPVGLEAVVGKERPALERMFGAPAADTVEVYGRKLQWRGVPCILDAYLYPDGKQGQDIAVHVDARRSDGAAVDRAACVAALARK